MANESRENSRLEKVAVKSQRVIVDRAYHVPEGLKRMIKEAYSSKDNNPKYFKISA